MDTAKVRELQGWLTLAGELKDDQEKNGQPTFQVERLMGSFQRRIDCLRQKTVAKVA